MSENKIPQAIIKLIADVEAAGGTATRDGDRNRWEFTLPRTFVDSDGNRRVSQQIAGTCGYFVRDGVAHYRGVSLVRDKARLWKINL